jgi:hypothetical protein
MSAMSLASYAAAMETRLRVASDNFSRANVRVSYEGGGWFSVIRDGGHPSKYRRKELMALIKSWESARG